VTFIFCFTAKSILSLLKKRKKPPVNSKLFNICDLDGSKIKPYFESLDGFESLLLATKPKAL